MRLTVWGSFGSIVSPDRKRWRYGGNTTCLEVTDGTRRIVIDAGIGIVSFAETMSRTSLGKGKGTLNLLFSHLHWDHVQGLPFFVPIFMAGNRLLLHGSVRRNMEESIGKLFNSKFSPIDGVEKLGADVFFNELSEKNDIDGFIVKTVPLHHPGGSTAFRIESGRKSVVFAFDHESGDTKTDNALRELAQQADIMVHDAQFDIGEALSRKGWGHSTWLDAVNNALAARVKTLVLFHHDPDRSDNELDAIGMRAAEVARGIEVIVARDRMIYDI